jgi:hypothetical protein
MNPDTRTPADAQVHRSTEIYRGRVFSFVTDALSVLALQRTWFYLHGVSGSRPPT